jgi:hypothetical protein
VEDLLLVVVHELHDEEVLRGRVVVVGRDAEPEHVRGVGDEATPSEAISSILRVHCGSPSETGVASRTRREALPGVRCCRIFTAEARDTETFVVCCLRASVPPWF